MQYCAISYYLSQNVAGADFVLWYLNFMGNHWTLMVYNSVDVL